MEIYPRHNNALNVNPPVGNNHLTTHGSDWLWAVTAVYLLSLLLLVGFAFAARHGERIFHHLFTIALLAGTIGYFTQASDLGNVAVVQSLNQGNGVTRQIFYARYITWFTTWPPVILALSLLSGVSWATAIYNIALSWTWICSWLAGTLVATRYKWGFYAFGLFAYILLAMSLLHTGTGIARRLGTGTHYSGLSGWFVFLGLLYAIAWGLDEGGNKISVTSGFIFYGILDLLMVPLISWAVLLLSRRWDYGVLGLHFTQYGRVRGGETYPEKGRPAGVLGEGGTATA